MLMISVALPPRMALLSDPTPLIPTMLHQSEYSFSVAAILDCRVIGRTLSKSLMDGSCMQNPWLNPVMSNFVSMPVEGTSGP